MKLLNLFVLLVIGLLCACSDDDKGYIDEIMDGTGAVDDTTNIAVTGLVDSYGVTYACLRGYANLNLMPMGSGEIGMEICLSDDEASLRQQTSSSLSGNTFVVEFQNLSPCTEYQYRSFVRYGGHIHYGQYRSFTTKDLSNVTVTEEVTYITHSSATIVSSVQLESVHLKDDFMVGVAYSTSIESFSSQVTDTMASSYDTWGKRSVKDLSDEVYTVTLGFLTPNTTYYYAAFADVGGKCSLGEVKSFTTEEDGFVPSGAVDLGLSVMWATCNLGANSPEEFGGYYAWGETEEKSDYSWDTYKWCKGTLDTMIKYCTDDSEGVVDGKTGLELEDDVVHVTLDGSWRMPTLYEIEELINECTWEWTTCNDVYGQLVTGPNDNSIFLPAAGYRSYSSIYSEGKKGVYLSAMLYKGYSSYRNYSSCCLRFDDEEGDTYSQYRSYGCSVRPVIE